MRLVRTLVLVFAAAVSAARPGVAAPASMDPPVNLTSARVIDLTHPFDEKTIYWPNAPSGFVLHRESFGKTPGGYFYASNDFSAPVTISNACSR